MEQQEKDWAEFLAVVLALVTEEERKTFFKANRILGRTKKKRTQRKQAKKMRKVLAWFLE